MKQYVENFFKYRYLIKDLIVRDLKVKYRRSVLGFLWSILNPLLMMLVITAVFQNMFQTAIDNFPIYYLTGYLLFNFVTEATSLSMTSVIGAGALIKKVYIPKYIFPLEKCLFSFVNMLLSFIAVIIVMALLKTPFTWSFFFFFIPMIYCLVFSIGLGMFLAAANVFFRDVAHLYSVFITAWMYLTPIFYPMEILPGFMHNVLRLNPLYHFVLYFRALVLQSHIPDLRTNLICMGFSLIFLVIGVSFFKKTQDKFILYI